MSTTNDATVWLYLDLAKYVGLLSRGLFFARPSALRRSDPWEGSCGELDFVDTLDRTVHANLDGVAQWTSALAKRHAEQDAFGISCWHKSDEESAALWRLYAPLGLGVAIKSSPSRVRAAISHRSLRKVEIDYGGHRNRRLGDNPVALLSTKRPEFRHEAEVRFLVQLSDDERKVLDNFYSDLEEHGSVRRIKPGSKSPLIGAGRAFATQDSTCLNRGAPAGMHMPTDTSALIERVVLAPSCSYALRRAVLDVTRCFGLTLDLINEATFDTAPYDKTVFEP